MLGFVRHSAPVASLWTVYCNRDATLYANDAPRSLVDDQGFPERLPRDAEVSAVQTSSARRRGVERRRTNRILPGALWCSSP